MKRIDGEIVIEDKEVPTLQSEQKKVCYTLKVNAYSKQLQTLNDWRKYCLVVDGKLNRAYLKGYHIGNGEYWLSCLNEYDKKPKQIELYRYG